MHSTHTIPLEPETHPIHDLNTRCPSKRLYIAQIYCILYSEHQQKSIMNHNKKKVVAVFILTLLLLLLIGIMTFHYAFVSNGDLFEKLQSSSNIQNAFQENETRMRNIHQVSASTNQGFYINPFATGCMNTTEKKCVDESVLERIDALAFIEDPKFKQVEHAQSFGDATWITLDTRSHFDKSRNIGIVITDNASEFNATFIDSPMYDDLASLDAHITERPTDGPYAFVNISEGVYIFYQYIPY